jgi:hypothetical protein
VVVLVMVPWFSTYLVHLIRHCPPVAAFPGMV